MALLAHGINATNGGTDCPVTIDSRGATLLVAGMENIAGANFPAIFNDAQGNTWVFPLGGSGFAGGSSRDMNFAYCTNPTSLSASHTISMTAAGGAFFPVLSIAAFDNIPTSGAFDDATTGAETLASGTTVQPGSKTPANADNMIVAWVTGDIYTPITINSGFTIIDTLGKVGGVSQGGGLAYLEQSAATAQNPQWTVATNDATAMTMQVLFKKNSSGAAAKVPYQPQYQMAPIMAQ